MTHEEEIAGFDVNGPGLPNKLFGLPFTPESAQLVVIPVPWDATTSYRSGTSSGPEAILKASRQIDFYHHDVAEPWKLGVAITPVPHEMKSESERVNSLVIPYRVGHAEDESASFLSGKVNEACENLNVYVRSLTQKYLDEGKLIGIVGGDHSTPLGFLRALSEKHDHFGVLQIDAHPDLRKAYEGFTYSHGSIMQNALKLSSVGRLVQVGVRDISPEDQEMMKRGLGRVRTYHFNDIAEALDGGKSWQSLCEEIVKDLPEKVYISFDIDGLDPKLCPNTGTPVPGGLEFHQAVTLIKTVVTSGRTIIGFDLCEVAQGEDDEWDGNVGARILWELCCWMGVSNKKLELQR